MKILHIEYRNVLNPGKDLEKKNALVITLLPSIFMTSVHPPPSHDPRSAVMWQYVGTVADPTFSEYALLPSDLINKKEFMKTRDIVYLKE